MLSRPDAPSFDLTGKNALVIGASRGIGAAASTALARAGAAVTVAGRSRDDLAILCESINGEGGTARPAAVDARGSAEVDAVFDSYGPFDVVVNSVGANRPALLSETSDDDLDDIVHLNIKVAFYIARAAVRSMQGAGIPGSIITVSSQMGHVGSPRRTVYSATKHALEGMTKSLAWEAGLHGIRVNTICPTFIETDMTAKMFEQPGFRDWVSEQTALGRPGRLEEVMGSIVFLASSASSLMTGSALMLDAGWTAR